MSDSRSSTTVTIAAGCSTCFACAAASSQRINSRSSSGRSRCGIGLTPARVQICPPTRPRQAPLLGIDRDHRMHQQAVGVAFLHRAEAAAALRRGRELHLAGVIDRQARAARRRRRRSASLQEAMIFAVVTFSLAKNRPAPQLTVAVAAQPFEANRFARDHLFEDRAPLYRRRRSPNVPSDQSMAAPVLSVAAIH